MGILKGRSLFYLFPPTALAASAAYPVIDTTSTPKAESFRGAKPPDILIGSSRGVR